MRRVSVLYRVRSYREPKVLNVLEFYDLIQVPLNVLEFVLNVLKCSRNFLILLLLITKIEKLLEGSFCVQ